MEKWALPKILTMFVSSKMGPFKIRILSSPKRDVFEERWWKETLCVCMSVCKKRRLKNVCMYGHVCTCVQSQAGHLLSAEASLYIFRGAALKDKVSGQVSSPGQPDANLSQPLLHPQLSFPLLSIVLTGCRTTAIGSLTFSASNYAVGPNIMGLWEYSQDEKQAITPDFSGQTGQDWISGEFRLTSDPFWFPFSAIRGPWASPKTFFSDWARMLHGKWG